MLRTAALAFLLGLAASASPLPEIRQMYARLSAAAEIKYVDALFSLQAPDFEAFSPDHQRVDLSLQHDRYEQLLRPALVCALTTEVLAFREEPKVAICRVRQSLRWEQVDPGAHKLIVRTVETLADDYWVRRKVGWRIRACQVLSQELTTREGGLGTIVTPPKPRPSK